MKKKNQKKSDIQVKQSVDELKEHRTPEEIEAFMRRLEKHVENLKTIPGMIDIYLEKK